MTKKMQKLIDDLKKELTDFGDRTENQLASLLSCNETKPVLELYRSIDEDKLIICICNLFLQICDLKSSLSHFKDCMAETFKDDEK